MLLVYTTQVNSAFCARWLANLEVNSQVLFTSEQSKKNKILSFCRFIVTNKVALWSSIYSTCVVYTYGLLTKCEVKMTGYWPSSFFACLWIETKSRSINSQKRTRPIFSHLYRTNLVNKGFIIWLLVKFCLRDTAGSPERARWLHLARSGSQSQPTIWFILPACGASHIIIKQLFTSVSVKVAAG